MESKIEDTNQITKSSLSGCDRLRQLLASPPQLVRHHLSDDWGTVAGTAGIQMTYFGNGSFKSHDKDTNEIIRALAACHLGLFADSKNINAYTSESSLNAQNSNASMTAKK